LTPRARLSPCDRAASITTRITFEQARNLAHGDPARSAIVRQSLKGKLQELVNR